MSDPTANNEISVEAFLKSVCTSSCRRRLQGTFDESEHILHVYLSKGDYTPLQNLLATNCTRLDIGENIKLLIDRPDGNFCFRLQKDRIFYVREDIMKRATCVDPKHLLSIGTCFGKFTKTKRIRLHITALDYLAPYAKYKVWLKPNAEQQFLYGHHVMKAGLGRITENTAQYQGVVVYNMNDLPLGFGVAAKATELCRQCDPMAIVVFHQADIGEYIRSEEMLI